MVPGCYIPGRARPEEGATLLVLPARAACGAEVSMRTWLLALPLAGCISVLLERVDGSGGDTSAADDTGAPPPEETGCFAADPTLVIGTSDTENEQQWIDMASGDAVTMVHGPQGGWHMLASVRVCGTTQFVRVAYEITDVGTGVVISDNDYQVALVQDEVCCGYYPGMYGYLDVSGLADGACDTPPELLVDHDVKISICVEDIDARAVCADVTVNAQPDADDLDDVGVCE
jgi:hypothetical protein